MAEYLLRRLVYTFITIFAVASILFIIFRLLPGDATLQVISPAMDESVQKRMKEAFGLDKSLWQQYLIYLKNLITFDWGRSFVTSQPVMDILQYRFWNTILLMTAGMCFTLVIGISVGILMAWHRNGLVDVIGTVSGLIFQAAPPFVTGLLLLMLLSYNLGLFPTGGMYPPGQRPDGVLDMLMMPAFCSP